MTSPGTTLWRHLKHAVATVARWVRHALHHAHKALMSTAGHIGIVLGHATAGIQSRHAQRLHGDRHYPPALAAGITAALSVLAPHPAIAAGLAVLVAEHLNITDSGTGGDTRHGDWDAQRPPTSSRPLWDPYTD